VEHPSEFATRVTLLGRLRAAPDDPAAWSEFVAWYGGKIYAWCRAWGLQESDAQDVTQEVFLNLSVRMHDFRYDPSRSFRAWLKTLTHHAWRDYVEKQRRPGRGSGSESVLERLAAVEAQEDLASRLAEAFDQEVLKEAAARVRLRVEPRTWDAFHLLAIEGRSGAEVAQRLRMKVATVFVARSKVQRMLREEVGRLDRD
jgi:RNA polymerase sigma-70 factor (ECF subfamily)